MHDIVGWESSVLRMLSWPLVAAVARYKRLSWDATAVAKSIVLLHTSIDDTYYRTYVIIRHLCMWSLGWASPALLMFCGLQSLSPGALALGHIRGRKLVLSTNSPHMHTSPPTTNAF